VLEGSIVVAFYGLKSFGCKTARFVETRCERLMTETSSIGNALQTSETMHNSLGLNCKISCTVRLSYHAYVIYVILGDVLTFVLTPVVHRSPLECRLPMKNREWRKGWDLSDVLPFSRLWYAEHDRECNRLREVLSRNCEGKKHAVRA
jgi:hypothetical protein